MWAKCINFRLVRKSDYQLYIVCPSVCLSTWHNYALIGRIFLKFNIGEFFENLSRTNKFHSTVTRMTGTLHKKPCKFMAFRWNLLKWEMSQTKVVQKIITHILCSINLFPKVVPFRGNVKKMYNTERHGACYNKYEKKLRFSCGINKVTDRQTLIKFNIYCFSRVSTFYPNVTFSGSCILRIF
jgi:hypothetical protein